MLFWSRKSRARSKARFSCYETSAGEKFSQFTLTMQNFDFSVKSEPPTFVISLKRKCRQTCINFNFTMQLIQSNAHNELVARSKGDFHKSFSTPLSTLYSITIPRV